MAKKTNGSNGTVQDQRQQMFMEFRSRLNGKAFRNTIASTLPQHMRTEAFVDRFLESIFVACRDNPKLLTECDRGSLFRSAERIAKKGLTVGDNMAWLVPYKGQVQDQLGYAGAMALVRRSGICSRFIAHTVYENDDFQIFLGTESKVDHRPALGDRGDVVGAYAVAWVDGEPAIEWTDRKTIDYVREKSPGKNSPAWRDWYDQMARKIPVKRLVKMLPTETPIDLTDADDSPIIEGAAAHIDSSIMIEHSTEQPINTVNPKDEPLPAEAELREEPVQESGKPGLPDLPSDDSGLFGDDS